MKHDTIQELLAKRAAGTLTEEELATLNTLARRDEVMAGAERRASVIRHRRRSVMAMVVGMVVVVAAGLTLLMPRSEEPLMAKQEAPALQVVDEELMTTPVEAMPMQTAAVSAEKTAAPAAAVQSRKQQPKTAKVGEPVVTCNNQCDADSVINDIWKFLTA